MAFEPVKWKPEQKRKFAEYLHDELENTIGDRAPLESKWVDLITQYRARVIGDGTADVPFIGASDLPYPLTAQHFDPIYADLMQTLHVPPNFWSVTAIRPDRLEYAKPVQEFLRVVEKEKIKMRAVNMIAFIDLVVLGTCAYKDSIFHRNTPYKSYDEGGNQIKRSRIVFDPRVDAVPLQDFFIPAYAANIDPEHPVDPAPWVAERFRISLGEFNARAKGQSPWLPNYDKDAAIKVRRYEDDRREDRVKERERQEDEYQPFRDAKITLYEVWARFDTDGNSFDEDIRVIWHHETSSILQDTHIPYEHGKRPYSKGVYMPTRSFYGIGLGESDEWAQIAMTRLVNNALNNTLLANQRMYGVPYGANVSPDEPVFGGKFWNMGPGEKITEVRLGEVYPSMFKMLQLFQDWSDRRTGQSEVGSGNISSLPSRTPATTVMSMLREGDKKFDMVLANLRDGPLADIGSRLLQNIIQISRLDSRYKGLALQALGEQDAQKVWEVLDSEPSEIEEQFGVSVTATSSIVNKEAEKQNFLALMQFVAQTYPVMIQEAQALAQLSQDPTILLQTIQASFGGKLELMKRLLESFDIQNPEAYLPQLATQTAAAAPAPAFPPSPPFGVPGAAPAQVGAVFGLGG